ncbi:unnamed protein product [Menidia menidia]|uniref:(Atlantic silverside) hypothetical protein n=1 Tax=Menidia menidia TaxID=238744 RepID=A0A8S4AH27_9TELE|nr:unnamed protein product [Menidia menidia]
MMLDNLCCSTCLAPLQPDDGHDLCPSCLGVEHLREALSDNACPNCCVMPRSVRLDRLAALEQPTDWAGAAPRTHLPMGKARCKRSTVAARSVPPKRAGRTDAGRLSTRVDHLTTELAQMKALLQSFQTADDRGAALPPEQDVMSVNDDDAVSVAASGTHFCADLPELGSGASGSDSIASQEDTAESVTSAIRTALARLQIGVPQAQPTASSAFFKRSRSETAFMVPPSAEYVQELHACWSDTKALSRLTTDGRVLAAMQEAPKVGLGQMPAVEPGIASLIIPPDEALRPNARCPRPPCRITDDLLCKAYDSGACMGRIGNSLSHLMLALSSSLESVPLDHATQGLIDASLQAFALMTRELGRTLSTLVHARRQVWLAQSPLTEPCRRTLRALPVVPGELFGSAALDALDRRGDSWQGFTDVIASQSAPGRLRVLHGGPQGLLLLPPSPRGWYQVRDQSRDLLQIGETELETKLGRGPFIPFEPRSLAGVLPGLRRAGGPAGDALGPATYVNATASFRKTNSLFVCYAGSRKGQALSKQRLAHWVVDVISKAYASQDRPLPAGVKCHSTRGMSTSFAAMTGVPLDVICRAASWKSPSTFTRFYRVNVAAPHPLQGILEQHASTSR